MSLYTRLVKEKERLGKKALRFPKTDKELLDRKRWERVMEILFRRYDYGIDDALDAMKRQDHLDEVASINHRR
jgi:hypothetical protein